LRGTRPAPGNLPDRARTPRALPALPGAGRATAGRRAAVPGDPFVRPEAMLDTLTLATFSEHVGSRFQLHFGAASPIEVELTEATSLAPETKRRPEAARET